MNTILQIIKTDPKFAIIYNNLGLLYFNYKTDNKKAENLYKNNYHKNTLSHAHASRARGKAYFEAKDTPRKLAPPFASLN